MRKLTMAACAAGLAIALGTGMASAAQASSVIVVGPGQSIQAAINAARPGTRYSSDPACTTKASPSDRKE